MNKKAKGNMLVEKIAPAAAAGLFTD